MNVTDRPKRTPRPWSKQVPEERAFDADVIVIGSGIGGMTTAALLSRLGRKVLVLEQHYVPGGFTHAFRRKGFEWDVGVHLVGGVDPITATGRILQDLTGGELEWEEIGEVYDRFFFPDLEIGFPNRPDDFRARLVEAFPDHEHEIDAYFAEVRATMKAIRGFWISKTLPGTVGRWLGGYLSAEAEKAMTTTVATKLDEIFSDDKLKSVVAAQWGYHGSVPSRASWGMQALIVAHYLYGAWYPVGGAKQIAKTMLKLVADAGGWTRICADVQEIVIEGGRAVGVRLADGETIRAPRIVSAAGAHTTVARLLPEAHRHKDWTRRVASHVPSAAHVCLYLGFHGDIEAAGASRASQWYYDGWSHEHPVWPVEAGHPVPRPHIVFTSFPSLKDPEHDPGPDLKHTGEMITFVPWEVFSKWEGTAWRQRGEDYEAFKKAMTDKLLEILYEHHPELKDMLVHAELATPLSTDHFSRPYKGSIYGLAHEPDRFLDPWLRVKSPVPGLWMSGCDVSCGGVMGAMMGGLLCGVAMEPLKALPWLRNVAARPSS